MEYYVATRKDTGGHFMFHGSEYLDMYERDFERIREFDDLEEAQAALAARESVDYQEKDAARKEKAQIKMKAGRLRGDVKKGSVDEEKLRAKIRAELEAEIAAEAEAAKEESKSGAKMGAKTTTRTSKA